MHRSLLLSFALALAALLGAAAGRRLSPIYAQATLVWDVQVGGDAADGTISTASFWPDSVAVHAGDTVRWTFAPSSELHTVFWQPAGRQNPPAYVAGPGDGEFTLGAAWFPIGPTGPDATYDDTQVVNSGADFGGADTPPFTLMFTKPGVYNYNCVLHFGMLGPVTVVAGDTSLPETPAQAQTRGQTQFNVRIANANSFVLTPGPNFPTSVLPLADVQGSAGGAGVHTVVAGLGFGGLVNTLQFLPGDLTVRRGDTVIWYNSDPLNPGHTVTFTSGAPAPDFPAVRVQSEGTPLLVLTADTMRPVGGSTYTGRGYINSGFLGPGRSFALTIGAPVGTYQYVCLVHRSVMKGAITVTE